MDDLTRRIFKTALKALQSPGAQQLLSSERVMQTLLKAFTLRKDFRDVLDARIRSMARSMNLLTKEDLREVEWTLRDVERRLRTLEAKGPQPAGPTQDRADAREVLKATTKASKPSRPKASAKPTSKATPSKAKKRKAAPKSRPKTDAKASISRQKKS